MKNLILKFIASFLLIGFVQISYAQTDIISPERKAEVQRRIDSLNFFLKTNGFKWRAGITSLSYMSNEEFQKLCGIKGTIDVSNYPSADSIYGNVNQQKSLQKTQSVTNWGNWVSNILNQKDYIGCTGGCWAYSAAFLADALLNNFYGSNVCNQIDPRQIIDNASCGGCSGSFDLNCGLEYLVANRTIAKRGPTIFSGMNLYYNISSESGILQGSISAIKNALQYSPVLTGMRSSLSFGTYIGGIYEHPPGEPFSPDGHAVVILGYDDTDSVWICANSWGKGWGETLPGGGPWSERGYFRIKYGDSFIGQIMATATVSSSNCLAKLIPDFQSFQTAANSPFASDERMYVINNTSASSGTISGEMLWVDFGKTLTVGSGVTLLFSPNTQLVVRGILNASGATFDKSSSTKWGGIIYDFGSLGGSLSNCTIKNAGTGIRCNGVLPSISNCTIRNNNIGLYLNNIGSPANTISGTLFQQNGQGIGCYYSSPQINGVTANYKIDNNNFGIFCVGSSPTISNTWFRNNGNGLYLLNYSYATLGTLNRLVDTRAIYADYNSHLQSWQTDVWPTGSQGSAVTASNSAIVAAQANYWGQYPPNSTNFYATNGAQIYYLPGSASPYTGGLYKASAQTVSASSNSNNSSTGDFFLDQTLLDAAKLMMDKRYNEAKAVYASEYKKTSNTSKKIYLLTQLSECYRAMGRNDFTDFLNSEVRINISKDDNLYAATLEIENLFLIRNKKYKKAVNNLSILKTKFAKNDITQKNALFNLGYIHTDLLADPAKGKEYFTELEKKYPGDILTCQSKLMLGEIDRIPVSAISLAKKSLAETQGPVKHELLNNYPNPFNPTTILNYSLPVKSDVKIYIYDITGRLVKSFISNSQSEGYHQIEWNSTDENGIKVASGVYIYRMEAVPLEENKTHIIQSRKMILLR